MAIHDVRASGLDHLALATELLQRARLADPEAGLWEAADLQWWWRTPRRSDAIEQLFWIDDGAELLRLLIGAGFVAGEDQSGITWMSAEDRPQVTGLPDGFVLVDRARE